MNEYLYPSIYEKSAALLFSIVQNQPFIDGNTRASVYSTIEFLKMNGIKTIDEKKIWFLAKKLSNKKYQNISYISHELIQLAA
jgi:prophage maintenance system killer protein